MKIYFPLSYSDDQECKKIFHLDGLMLCKLTPDDSKMVISTDKGYLLLVHDLDLDVLNVDMDTFKVILYILVVNIFFTFHSILPAFYKDVSLQ